MSQLLATEFATVLSFEKENFCFRQLRNTRATIVRQEQLEPQAFSSRFQITLFLHTLTACSSYKKKRTLNKFHMCSWENHEQKQHSGDKEETVHSMKAAGERLGLLPATALLCAWLWHGESYWSQCKCSQGAHVCQQLQDWHLSKWVWSCQLTPELCTALPWEIKQLVGIISRQV